MNRAALFALALVAAAPAVGGEIANNQNPIAAIPLSSLSATRERPVFSPTRRPPAPPPRPSVAARGATSRRVQPSAASPSRRRSGGSPPSVTIAILPFGPRTVPTS